ncbi:MAG: hypothetical protein ACOY4K_00540 [Pseudomonadota bacterium]
MATCNEVVKGAFRRAGISRDLDEVRPREMERGLQVLQDIYLGLVGSGAFGRFNDVDIDDDYTAEEQDRILVNTESAVTVTLPQTVEDGYATDGVRPPLDGAVVMVTDVYSTARSTYVYDASYAAWTAIESLALASFAPLSVRYRAGLEARLAVRLAEENGVPVTPELRRQEAQGIAALLHRFDAPRRETEATYY